MRFSSFKQFFKRKWERRKLQWFSCHMKIRKEMSTSVLRKKKWFLSEKLFLISFITIPWIVNRAFCQDFIDTLPNTCTLLFWRFQLMKKSTDFLEIREAWNHYKGWLWTIFFSSIWWWMQNACSLVLQLAQHHLLVVRSR